MSGVDLDYRPTTYFRPQRLEEHLLAGVKGAVARDRLREGLDAGDTEACARLLEDGGIPAGTARALEAVHPMFMGGNYLPDREPVEVEIARIHIESTTHDVTCVYAARAGDGIRYRVVDEYDGDTLEGPETCTSTLPLTVGELADFFLTAWPLMDVLEMNFDLDLERAEDFYAVESAFYVGRLENLIRQRVAEDFRRRGWRPLEEEA